MSPSLNHYMRRREMLMHSITRMARKISLLTDGVLDRLSALIYYRSLDVTTLRELIGYNGRLIAEDPTPGVPRADMPA
ncbi:hypothetical protein Tco_1311525 [Tanacetum coccineum]